MEYNFRALTIVSLSILFVSSTVTFLNTYNYETIEKSIRTRKLQNDELIRYPSLKRRTSIVSKRRNNIEVDVMPKTDLLEGKCELDLIDVNRQAEISTDNTTTSPYMNIDVEYWFAIGTTANKFDDLSLFQLQQHIYTSVDESNIWCTSTATSSSDNSNSTAVSRLGVITFIPAVVVPSSSCMFFNPAIFLSNV